MIDHRTVVSDGNSRRRNVPRMRDPGIDIRGIHHPGIHHPGIHNEVGSGRRPRGGGVSRQLPHRAVDCLEARSQRCTSQRIRKGFRRVGSFGCDAGSASLVASVWILVLAVALALGACLSGLWGAHARAGMAADLGALAGAGQILAGAHAACSAAREVVLENAARLVECRVGDVDVRVVAAAAVPAGFARIATGGHGFEVRSHAHATITSE